MLDYLKGLCVSVRLDGETYTAVLKPEYAINGERVLRTDSKNVNVGKWVTINGAHVLIGKNGLVLGGAGGKFNGMNLSDSVRKLHRNRDAIVKAQEYKKLKPLADRSYELRTIDGQIKETEYGIAMRTKIFGARHFKVTQYKIQLKGLKAKRRQIEREQKQAQAKMDKIKAKYPNVESLIKTQAQRKHERDIRTWARENGYNQKSSLAALGNFRDRAVNNKPYRGGIYTGDSL